MYPLFFPNKHVTFYITKFVPLFFFLLAIHPLPHSLPHLLVSDFSYFSLMVFHLFFFI